MNLARELSKSNSALYLAKVGQRWSAFDLTSPTQRLGGAFVP
jgi:hypothetical protein